jgi:hypothetical protein
MAKYKKSYNADTNKFEAVSDKPTPASNTRKKMKRAAEANKAKSPKSKPAALKSKGSAKAKAPIPKDRPKKGKESVKGLQLPSNERANASAASNKLKGPVPKKNKKPYTKGGNTGDKSKKGANQIATYIKKKKQLGV